MMQENIFSALSKYISPKDENYLTESFVYVINSLLVSDRRIACDLINILCVQNGEFSFDPETDIVVTTQEVTELGRPDIKITAPGILIYIEVKHNSPLGYKQISRYKNALSLSEAQIKHVALLTRYDIEFKSDDEKPYKHTKWVHVYAFLSDKLIVITEPLSKYLVQSFLNFLEVKQMSVERVGWEYIKGVPEMLNLMNMIEFSIQNAGITLYDRYPRAVALEWRGFYLETNNYLCGIYFSEPTEIFLQVVNKKDHDATKIKPTYNMTEERKSIWFFLQLEDHYFFSLDREKQVSLISDFIKTSFGEAKQMQV